MASVGQASKSLEDVKTVSFNENAAAEAAAAAATSNSAEKPPTIPQKAATASSPSNNAANEESKAPVDSGNRTSVRTSVNGSIVPTSGNVTL